MHLEIDKNNQLEKNIYIHLRCITIVHPVDRIEEYRFFAAFFRFIGVWVFENLSGDEHGDPTDAYIRIDNSCNQLRNWTDISVKNNVNALYHRVSNYDSDGNEKKYQEKNWLSILLNHFKSFFCDSVFYDIKEIARYFTKFDLMRASYAIEYFGDTDLYEIYEYMSGSMKKFSDAYDSLIKVHESEKDESKYLLAAQCYCQRRINELYTAIWNAYQSENDNTNKNKLFRLLCGSTQYQLIEDIENKVIRAISIDPSFYGIYAIRASAKLVDRKYKMEAIYDMEKALTICGERTYSSCLMYRIAKCIEKFWGDDALKLKFYFRAVQLDRNNYRALYKIAIDYKRKKEYKLSLECWKRILGILSPKEDLYTLQPVECAYLYKTYYNMGLIYLENGQYNGAIEYLKHAKKFGSSDRNMKFYNWMFGNYGENFKIAAVHKLNLGDCMECLAEAYAMLNMPQNIEKAYEI